MDYEQILIQATSKKTFWIGKQKLRFQNFTLKFKLIKVKLRSKEKKNLKCKNKPLSAVSYHSIHNHFFYFDK